MQNNVELRYNQRFQSALNVNCAYTKWKIVIFFLKLNFITIYLWHFDSCFIKWITKRKKKTNTLLVTWLMSFEFDFLYGSVTTGNGQFQIKYYRFHRLHAIHPETMTFHPPSTGELMARKNWKIGKIGTLALIQIWFSVRSIKCKCDRINEI